MKKPLHLLVVFASGMLLSGCNNGESILAPREPGVTATPTPIATASATATATPVVTATPTPVVTATPTPAATATPTPTATPTTTPTPTSSSMVTTYYGEYAVPPFGGTGKTSGYTTAATNGCFTLTFTQAPGGTAGRLRLRAATSGSTTCTAPVVANGYYVSIATAGTVTGSTYTEDPAAMSPFGGSANTWVVYQWVFAKTAVAAETAAAASSSDNAVGFGAPNETDCCVYTDDTGLIASFTISNLTPTSGSGSFTLQQSDAGGTGGANVIGTVTITGSTTN
jgi:hypothetical protein